MRILRILALASVLFSVQTHLFAKAESATQTQKTEKNRICIITGNSIPTLAEKIAKELGIEITPAKIGHFNDGETSVQINGSIRGKDVYIIQSTCTTADGDVNNHLMELYFMIRAAKRSHANSITVVMPYYGYARQDRKSAPRVPISASDVAMMLEVAGANQVIVTDLHCGQIQGFFRDAPVDNLVGSLIFAPHIASLKLDNIVIVSPDAGGVERAKKFQEALAKLGVNASLAMISKERSAPGVVGKVHLIGEVKGMTAIVIDDICDTGGTLAKGGEELKNLGAKQVFACFTHPVFSKDALNVIDKSVFEQVITTDTIPLRGPKPDKLVVLSVAPMIAKVIDRTQRGESVSELFNFKS